MVRYVNVTCGTTLSAEKYLIGKQGLWAFEWYLYTVPARKLPDFCHVYSKSHLVILSMVPCRGIIESI